MFSNKLPRHEKSVCISVRALIDRDASFCLLSVPTFKQADFFFVFHQSTVLSQCYIHTVAYRRELGL